MHRRVDLAFDPNLTLSDRAKYGAALSVLYGALRTARAALSGPQVTPYQHFIDRVDRRLQWLESDLLELGMDFPSTVEGNLSLPTEGSILGCLYVLEGSALGGQVIAMRVKQRMGISPENGGRYFHGLGRDTGKHWREFIEILNRSPPDSAVADDAVGAARTTFAVFERMLAGAG